MTSTKAEILALLKRRGSSTISEIAASVHLAPVTVRQHMIHLQRDGLVAGDRNGAGGTRFRLTAKAHAAAFPRRSDRIVELLVREIGFLESSELAGLTPVEKTSLVVRRLATRVAEEYAPVLQGWPLQERVVFVAEVMHEDGGFAEWSRTERGFELRDFSCLFHRLLDGENGGGECEWHASFLRRVLGANVRVEPQSDSSTRCCRYEILELVTA